jgi:small nuclear ribonucleoprotein (snRNP)-like protein
MHIVFETAYDNLMNLVLADMDLDYVHLEVTHVVVLSGHVYGPPPYC